MPTAAEILEQVRRDPKIPAPSQAVFKVLELTKDPQCDPSRVAAVIQRDGGLTGQLLRQANSALYSFVTPTSSVNDAVVRLGLKAVRSAVVNQHVVNALGRTCPPGFHPQQYWQGTFAASVAAHDLCKELHPKQADDASTAGLLCNLGIGLMAYSIPRLYQTVLTFVARESGGAIHAVERRLLNTTHAEVAAAVLEDWKLDRHIIDAVRFHHSEAPDALAEPVRRFSRIVAAAGTLSHIALDGSEMDSVALLFSQLEGLAKDADALVTRLLDRLVQHIQSSAASYAVELGSIDQMQQNFEDLIRGLPDVGKEMSSKPVPQAADAASPRTGG